MHCDLCLLRRKLKPAFNGCKQCVQQTLRHPCPTITTILISTYQENSMLHLDDDTLLSQEGTILIQGDPLAITMYELDTRPLIDLKEGNPSVKQLWSTDDAAVVGFISAIKKGGDYTIFLQNLHIFFLYLS